MPLLHTLNLRISLLIILFNQGPSGGRTNCNGKYTLRKQVLSFGDGNEYSTRYKSAETPVNRVRLQLHFSQFKVI